jgi:tRNA nucleotidyltransferase (CCA-adding enzyme)
VQQAIEDYVRGLDLDAYLVGGAVRDELLGLESKDADFLVPGVDAEELRARLEPHGRVEDLVVAGRLVGLRLYPRDRSIRALVPTGIELAPPRRERSTGPGRHDFEIVVDPEASVEDDLARRDFTVNALARRLADGSLLDPFDGAGDLERRVLRTVSERSFAEDPLRLVRGLRLVSQFGLEPDESTRRQMREEAASVRLVSGERVGGGIRADAMGELSKLLLGAEPARSLRIARDTGVLSQLLPEFEPAIGFDQDSRWHDLPVDEHTFEVVQATADAERPLRVRLAGLFHDVGKPRVAWRGRDGHLHFYRHDGSPSHEEVGARLADAALRRLRYPNDLRNRVVQIVRHHMLQLGRADARRARALLARHGEELALDLIDHKEADLRGQPDRGDELAALARFRAVLMSERSSPHRLADLEVDGDDLIAVGYRPGPGLGRALDQLLHDVVADPSLNRRDWLLRRARALLG